MSDPKNPVPGDKAIDASDLTLVDVTPEQMNKFVKVRDGVVEAMACVTRLVTSQVDRIGLHPEDVARLGVLKAHYEYVERMLPAAEKLAEMLRETRASNGHEIAILLGEMASQARRRAVHDADGASILGPLEDLMTYQYGPAKRGALARAKAKEEETTPPTK